MTKPQNNVMKLKPYSYPVSFYEKLRGCRLLANDVLKLNYNEPTFLPSRKVLRSLKEYISTGNLNWYPEGRCDELRDAICKYTGANQSEIIVGNGSDELILVLAMTYLAQGDMVVIPIPNYEMFDACSRSIGANIVELPCEDDLSFDYKKIIEATTPETKAIYLSNPNAPIGYIFTREQIKEILENARGAIVIVDEAYFEYSKLTVADMIREYDNLVVLRTFSKAFSIGSLRLGYLLTSESNAKDIEKVKELLPESVNKFAQIAGVNSLADLEYYKRNIRSVLKARDYLIREIAGLGLKTYGTNSNFMLIRFNTTEFALEIFSRLEKRGIFVRERVSKPKLGGCLRIGIPRYEEAKKLFKILKQEILKAELGNLDTLIFDMDGVLVDVTDSYGFAIKKTAELFLKKKISYEQIQNYKEKGGLNNDWDCVKSILKDNDVEIDRQIIISEFDKIYLGGAIDNERLIIKKNLLEKLSEKYRLSIVTGRPKRDADYTIDKFDLRRYFQKIITLDDVEKGKPDPEGIFKCLNYFRSKRAIYFGDTVDDMAASGKAGIPGIGIIPPNSSNNISGILIEKGASMILTKINELQEAI